MRGPAPTTGNPMTTQTLSSANAATRQTHQRPTVSTMRAAVITAPNGLEVRNVPLPNPGPNQVRIRLEGCGVCASNIPPWEGRPWFNYPMEPGQLGHEGWGVIDEVGEHVPPAFKVGERVAMLSG